jgi:RNA polymerase sigma factor, sigma-70 family
MIHDKLEKYINYLLAIAIKKCDKISDAEDIVQETLLAYLSKTSEIENITAWLTSVLNRKYYDLLRRKYKLPTVSIDNYENLSYEDEFEEIYDHEEAELIRKQVAYLSKFYRDVVVRHYLKGETIEKISNDLRIPEGTVKSRLYSGREQLKKGFGVMENYSEQSYKPIRLNIGSNGNPGLDGEPEAIIRNDLMAQNILYTAYKKPLTEHEIAKALGIPMAYIEPVIARLVDNELMARTGNKVYTDFIFFTLDERLQFLQSHKQYVADNFNIFWSEIDNGLRKLSETDFYKHLSVKQQHSIELHFVMECVGRGFFEAESDILGTHRIIPERPNGGQWVAMGFVFPMEYESKKYFDIFKNSSYGERIIHLKDEFETKNIIFHVYDPGFISEFYYNKHSCGDANLTRLLYIIESGINPDEIGFNVKFAENIPWYVDCGILRMENDVPKLDIPILSWADYGMFYTIANDTREKLKSAVIPTLKNYLANKKHEVPSHLKSVPLINQYFTFTSHISMIMIYEAQKRGVLYYDENYNDNKYLPMFMVIDK